MKLWRNLFGLLALALSHLCCVVVAVNYCYLLWAPELNSAPASAAFYLLIPYGAGVVLCLLLALFFHKKAQ